MEPAWKSYMANWQDKFRIGTLFFGDYRFYSLTGFQPQELDNINNPGPGNNSFNSFDVSRVYTNLYFFPTKDWQFRFTPEIYKTIGCPSSTASCNDNYGNTSAGNNSFGSNLDGDLSLRLKYAYLQYLRFVERHVSTEGRQHLLRRPTQSFHPVGRRSLRLPLRQSWCRGTNYRFFLLPARDPDGRSGLVWRW